MKCSCPALGLVLVLLITVLAAPEASGQAGPKPADLSPTQHKTTVEIERGGFSAIGDMEVLSPSSILAVGANALIHYDGANWRLSEVYPEVTEWTALDAPKQHGWAVGYTSHGGPCFALRLDQASRFVEHVRDDCVLKDVSVTPSGEAWAVGYQLAGGSDAQGLIVHHDGRNWDTVPLPEIGSLSAVKMFADDAGWATGSRTVGDRTEILFLRYDGEKWQLQAPVGVRGLRTHINAIAGVSDDDVWAVGGISPLVAETGIPSQLLMHYAGDHWTVIQKDLGELNTIKMVSETSGWAAGAGGSASRYDGSAWEQVYYGGQSRNGFLGIAVVDGQEDVWFGGVRTLVHFDGRDFSPWVSGWRFDGLNGLTGIAGVEDGSAWAVGPFGLLLHRNAGRWTEVIDYPHQYWTWRVAAVSASDVWLSYYVPQNTPRPPGTLAHYDGLTWTEVALPTQYAVWDFSIVDANDIWAVAATDEISGSGAGADILHYDGNKWLIEHSIPDRTLRAIDMLAHDEGWAVGAASLHYRDGGWEEVQVIPDGYYPLLHDVAFLSKDHGWAMGGEYVLEYIDGMWRDRSPMLTMQDAWMDLAVAPSGEVWMAGRSRVLCFDGRTWESVPIPYEGLVPIVAQAVDIVPLIDGYEVLVAGQFDTIIRITQGPASPTTVTAAPSSTADPSHTATPTPYWRVYFPALMAYR